MENEFMANLQQEGKIPAESEKSEKETPTVPPTEKEPEDTTASPAEQEPKDTQAEKGEPKVFHAFHEHPRWIATQTELKELRQFKERVDPLLDKLSQEPKNTEEEAPQWFKTLYGDDKEAWAQYRQYDSEKRKALRAEILEEIKKEEVQRNQEQKKLDEWIDSELKNLEADGFTFNKNELLKVALDYLPTDEEGNISLRKAYQIWEAKKEKIEPAKPQAEEKKKIADKTTKKGNASEEKRDYKTSADFRGKSFADISRE